MKHCGLISLLFFIVASSAHANQDKIRVLLEQERDSLLQQKTEVLLEIDRVNETLISLYTQTSNVADAINNYLEQLHDVLTQEPVDNDKLASISNVLDVLFSAHTELSSGIQDLQNALMSLYGTLDTINKDLAELQELFYLLP